MGKSRVAFLLMFAGAVTVVMSAACGTSDGGTFQENTDDTLDAGISSGGNDAGKPFIEDGSAIQKPDAGSEGGSATNLPPAKIEHVVIIVQENHTFDAYFGRYCTAKTGSNPTCNIGPTCCEAAPDTDPTGVAPTVLNDAQNGARDPNHTQACELSEMDNGKMDMYATASCGDPTNFAIASDDVMSTYHGFASQYALADRYFQPLVGQSSSNDMYLAVAKYVFTDNAYEPDATGHGCSDPIDSTTTYTGQTTIADLLLSGGSTFSYYAEYFDAMYASTFCPSAPGDCPLSVPTLPCTYDPGDVPFEYYSQFQNNHTYMKDYEDDFPGVLANGSLPNVSFIKAVMYRNEHPGYGDTISQGVAFVAGVVDSVEKSQFANNTLILLTWDEGGGFFDHITPPANSTVDNQPYGTRIPMLAMGRFAKKNYVSHVQMEHSSILKFLEWNFLGGKTGQLAARDAVVNNIGDMIDETQLITPVPVK